MAYILSKAPIFCRTTFHKNIIFGSIIKITGVRNQHYTNKINVFEEKKLRLKDNISNDYKLIYKEQRLVNAVTTFAYYGGWIGVILSALLAGYMIYKDPPVQTEPIKFSRGGVLNPLTKLSRSAIVLFCFVISISLIVCGKIIPFRIYYSSAEKMYKAVLVRSLLGKKQIVTFGEGTAVPIFKRKQLGDILFKINGHTILLDKECFPMPHMRDRMIKTN